MKRTAKKTTKTTKPTKTIGRQGVYVGTTHPWAKDLRIEIVNILRGDQVLSDDSEIGNLRADDLIAFAPEIVEKDGTRRFSWATSDATLADLRLDD